MSIHREFRRLTERHSVHSEEAARLRRLLGEVAVTIDATCLELERIEPAWGSEAVRPPFRSAWVEERFPGEHASYAVLVRSMDAPEAREFMTRAMAHDAHWQGEPPSAIGNILFAQNNLIGTAALSAAGALRCLPIMKSAAGPLAQGYGVIVPYDAEGRLFFRGSQGEPGAGTLKILDLDFPPVPYPLNRDAMDRLRAASIMASHAATTVYSLLNCRNIALVDKGPAPGRPAMGQEPENRRHRGGKTGLTWKVLTIRPVGGRRSPGGPGEAGEPLTRAHLVRGHFKTFTAEKPLLGRAVGRFWWSPQVRGSAERGAVFKDYSLEK